MTIVKLFFDLDGTLLNTWKRSYKAYTIATRNLKGMPISKSEFIKVKRDGISNADIMAKSKVPVDKLESFKEMIANNIEKDWLLNTDKLYRWVVPTLIQLTSHYEIFLLTSRKRYNGCLIQLQKLGINSFFKHLYITENKSDITKNLLPKSSVIVSDTEDDIDLGNKSGLLTVGVTWGHRNESILRLKRPTYLTDSAKDLFDFLVKLAESEIWS
ncbi:MAG: HAD hydrolase-like protein [Thermoplasmatales archaeon]